MEKLKRLADGSRVLLLTHTDMDGAGPAILLRSIFEHVDVFHCSNGEMSKMIRNMATDPETVKKYDFMIITDISCSEEDAEIINRFKTVDLVLLDHHPTATGLNRFPWAYIQPMLKEGSFRDAILYGTDRKSVHSSGTSLMYDYLEYCGLADQIPNRELAKYLVFLIAGYDTWDWNDVFKKDMRFRDLQTVFAQYGISEFEDAFTKKLSDPGIKDLFDDTDMLLLRIAEKKKKYFLEEVVAHRISTGNVKLGEKYYSFTYCSVSENMADVFEYMRANYDVDLHIVDYGTGISIRTNRSDINVGEIAKRAGGGGHPGAGGVKVPFEKRQALLEDVLGATFYFD